MKFFFATILLFAFPLTVFAKIPNDPLYDQQSYLEMIHAPAAWDTETGSSNVIVAVLDSGVDLEHPDLKDQIWVNKKEIPNDGLDNDQNGYVDDVNGWDFVGGDNNPSPSSENGVDEGAIIHGTLVSGIIGAEGNNGEGITGVNWRVKLMPVRMLDGIGAGDTRTAAAAIYYAVANGAKIINMSFSGTSLDTYLESAIRKAYRSGVLIVAATGNLEGGGLNMDETPVYPTCFENGEDWVLGVAALDVNNKKADFSNYGKNCTDVSAPGTDIFGAQYRDAALGTEAYGGTYDGTSVAAPIVTGVAALLLAHYPTLTVAQLETSIQLSVDPVATKGTYYEGKLGSGRVNAQRALEVAGQYAVAGQGTTVAEQTTQTKVTTFVGAAKGEAPTVKGLDAAGNVVVQWNAYAASFLGGVNVAVGDLDGDGVDEVVTGAGAGGGPHVRIFKQDGTLVNQFFAYSEAFRGGVNIAVADTNGDGVDEIVTGAGFGGGPQVRIFDETGNVMSQFFAFDATDRFGVHVATDDADKNGVYNVIATEGTGGSRQIRTYTSSGVLVGISVVF